MSAASALGDLLLLLQDFLLAGRLGERARRVGLGRGGFRLGLDLGLLEVEGPLGDGDLLGRLEPGLLRGALGDRLGDVRLLLGAGGFGAAEVFEVGALGGDVLDLEGVQDQALPGEAGLRLLRDLAGERGTVADDVLDRHPADDGAQRAGEHFLGEADDAVLLLEEALGGGPDRFLAAADLDDRDAFEVRLHSAQGDGSADGHRDVPAGQVEGELLLDERDDEDSAADDDLLAAVVDAGAARHRVGRLLAAASGDDERLAGPGDLVAGDDDEGEQYQEYDDSDDCGHDWAHKGVPPASLWGRQLVFGRCTGLR